VPGLIAPILHAHLPFVRHPEHEDFLEEDWFFEALSESYLPLLRMMRRLADDEVPFRLTVSLTPTLGAMLRDELLQTRYLRHLERLLGLAHQEVERNRNHPRLVELSTFYARFFNEIRDFYCDSLQRDVVGSFRELQDAGHLEICASAATHPFLPLLDPFPESQQAQILIGCDAYREMFGRDPVGFWLPECGYSPALDSLLNRANIRWFALDSHGLMFAQPQPLRAIFAPCYTPAGPAAFARDRELNQEIWSSRSGYPGHALYRDFYRDIGFDRSKRELEPFLLPAHVRKFSGLKYHAVSTCAEKELYDPEAAQARAEEDAADFFAKCAARFREIKTPNFDPVIVSPFDAELFGHWWFEGPHFLESLIRRVAVEPEELSLTTPSEFLSAYPSQQVVRPNPSSWGAHGFGEVWINEKNAWIYPELHSATRQMTELARRHRDAHEPAIERALRQIARELLLAQASDWAFLIKTNSAPEYATRRVRDHLQSFERISAQLSLGEIDLEFVGEREERVNLFPNLNWRYFL
jgi:1,4-alpha-glucan branching enzyme